MPSTKRSAAAADASSPNTRAKKAPKTDTAADETKTKRTKKAPAKKKGPLPPSQFKSQALPIHVHLTHTPAPVDKEDAATNDPGFLGSITLLPTNFSTGSYGWKAMRKIEVELENPEEGKPKEKVSVQFQINATVVGSKSAKDEDGGEDKGKADEAEEKKDDEADANDD